MMIFSKWGHIQRHDWEESCGQWAYLSSCVIQLIWAIPFTLLMLPNVLKDNYDAFVHPLSALNSDPQTLLVEFMIYASLFAFMVKDAFLFYENPDPLLALHHVCVMYLMVCLYFHETVPGFRALAFVTPVVEIGTAAFCAWQCWRPKATYLIVMTGSNTIFGIIISTILYLCPNPTAIVYFLYISGVGLIIGRQGVLIAEMMKYNTRQATLGSSKKQ